MKPVGLVLALSLASLGVAQVPAVAKSPLVTDAAKSDLYALAKVALPPLPALPELRELEPGVHFAEVDLAWPRGKSKLWIYLPDPAAKPKSLPCIVTAPAGSNLLFGMALGDGDRAEHLPFVKAGFAVVAYEIEGVMPDDDAQTDENVLRQLRAYTECWAGLQDGHAALEYALTKLPAVDTKRVYTTGHSSAATMALMLAAHEPRLAGCAAFMPIVDVKERIGDEYLAMLEKDFAGYGNFLVRNSPVTHAARYAMPLFLFGAEDDDNVDCGAIEKFAELVRGKGKQATFAKVAEGGHYEAMIAAGIPQAIAWLQTLGMPVPPKGKAEGTAK